MDIHLYLQQQIEQTHPPFLPSLSNFSILFSHPTLGPRLFPPSGVTVWVRPPPGRLRRGIGEGFG